MYHTIVRITGRLVFLQGNAIVTRPTAVVLATLSRQSNEHTRLYWYSFVCSFREFCLIHNSRNGLFYFWRRRYWSSPVGKMRCKDSHFHKGAIVTYKYFLIWTSSCWIAFLLQATSRPPQHYCNAYWPPPDLRTSSQQHNTQVLYTSSIRISEVSRIMPD
jgi:hypothetical protein